jgi:predicted DNA-binding transcriptional regulator AlpA
MSKTITVTDTQLNKLIREASIKVWLSPKEFASCVGCTDKHIWHLLEKEVIKKPSYSLGSRSPRWHIDYINEFMGGSINVQ